MNGFKYYALLATIALAVTCPLSTMAADNGKDGKTTVKNTQAAHEPGVDLPKGQDRSISIDELYGPTPQAGAAKHVQSALTKSTTKSTAKTTVKVTTTVAKSSIKPAHVVAKTPQHPQHIVTAKAASKHPVVATQKTNSNTNPKTEPQASTPQTDVATKATEQGPAQVIPTNVTNPANVIPVAQTSLRQEGPVVTAWLDRRGTTPKYKVGDKMVVNVTAATDCNVVVFDYDSKGTLTQLFPNQFQQSGFIKSGENVQIGGPDSAFDYEVSGKNGLERVFVYAYPTSENPPAVTVAMNTVANSPFRSVEMTPEKYRELVNKSQVFFSREVKVVPKKAGRLVSQTTVRETTPNKIELTFEIEQ